MKAKKELQTALVKHVPSVKNEVARFVVGTEYNIGSFYDFAALAMLKIKSKKK